MPRKNKSIPDGWQHYSNIGKQVPNTRFLPFKVPLKEDTCRQCGETFTPHELLKNQPNLKLIIDLTNVDNGRYYYAEDFISNGINVIKIKCSGGPTSIPPKFLVTKFKEVVDQFIKNGDISPAYLIGVHCTHGLNRTGYFICKYMIENMGIDPQKALDDFQMARGHHMERPLLIQDILNNSPESRFQSPLASCYDDEPTRNSRRYRRY